MYICCFLLLITSWGSNIESVDAVKHWYMKDNTAHVRGTIIETFGADGFKLADDTGEMRVRFDNTTHLHSGMRVEVCGEIERQNLAWDLRARSVRLSDNRVVGQDKQG